MGGLFISPLFILYEGECRMDYLKLAGELSHVKRRMAENPDFRKLIETDSGENFVLGYFDDNAEPIHNK